MEFIVGQKYILPPVVTHKSRTQPIYDAFAGTTQILFVISKEPERYHFEINFKGLLHPLSFTHEELESCNINSYGTSHTIGFTCPSGH